MTVKEFNDKICLELMFGNSLATYPDYYSSLAEVVSKKKLREELKIFAKNYLSQKCGMENPTSQFLGRCATRLALIFIGE